MARSRGLGDVYKRQGLSSSMLCNPVFKLSSLETLTSFSQYSALPF
jgi:hypothetical protein